MQFVAFAEKLKILEETPSRLAMTEQLVSLFEQLEIGEVQPVCYLLQGRLVPQYESLEFNLSVKMVLRTLNRLLPSKDAEIATNLFGEQLEAETKSQAEMLFKELGDIGLVAEKIVADSQSAGGQTGQGVGQNISQVFAQLQTIAKLGGEGSQELKIAGLLRLLERSEPISARFIARIVVGKLRLGFATMTMLDALSWLVSGGKDWTAKLEKAWEKRADLGYLATLWVAESRNQTQKLEQVLDQYSVQVGTPVMPALCQRLNSAGEIIEKLTEVVAEPKYDGLRLQIHYFHSSETGKPTVKAYTRSLEDCTYMFPELAKLAEIVSVDSCILDCEAIGYDPETGKLKVFQETITRKRKHDVAEQSQSVPIRFYVFDVLEMSGESLLQVPLLERKQKLQQIFNLSGKNNETQSVGNFFLTPFIVTSDAVALHQFHEQALADGLEGAVMKQAQSQYQSGRKGWRWVKIKETEGSQGKLADTLDVVMMGYYQGKGKRTQFGLGAILTGVVDAEGNVVTIGKSGTGMNEDQLVELKTLGDQHQSAAKPAEYGEVDKSLQPDVWLEPSVVIEVAADELTESPVHSAGFALRFPRLLRIRDDKTWQQATSLAELQQIRKGA